MKSWFKRHPILSVLCLAVISWLGMYSYRGYYNMQGYCWEEQRYLTEDETIRRLITSGSMMKYDDSQRRGIERKTGDKIKALIDYKNVDEFLKLNPECCVSYEYELANPKRNLGVRIPLEARVRAIPYYWRFFGWAQWRKSVNVKIYYITQNDENKYHHLQWGRWVNNCGNPVRIPFKYRH